MANVTHLRDSIWQKLPPVTRELVELIGWHETRKLARLKGGQTIYIPSKETRTFKRSMSYISPIIRKLLIKRFAQSEILIPQIGKLMTADRDNDICKDYDMGLLTVTEISLKWNLKSMARASQIVKEHCK